MSERIMPSADRSRTEGGFTLVEMLVTSVLLLIVLAIFMPLIYGSINTFDAARFRSDSTDQAELAFTQIEHDVVSSNLLWIQSVAGSPDVVHIQTYSVGPPSGSTTTTSTAPPLSCVEYEVAGGLMQRRTRTPSGSWPTGWTTVMTGIVNSTQTPVLPVFSVPGPTYQSLVVQLWVNSDTRTAGAAAPSYYTDTVTGSGVPANGSSTSGACA